jgi:FkbM family methyltransferase
MNSEQFVYDYNLDTLRIVTPKKRVFNMLATPRWLTHLSQNAYEDFTSDLLLNFIKDDMLFIDVGAHYGYYTLLVGTSHPNCKIIAFEPVPENYEILRRNIELNQLKNVVAYRLAVSNTNGFKNLHISENSGHCSFHEHPLTKDLRDIEVETVCLDNFLKNIPKVPTVIKIDTEGHEICVLEGMEDILRYTKNIKLLVEFNPRCLSKAGYEPQDLLRKISQFGFDIYFIYDDERVIYKVGENKFAEWTDYMPEQSYKHIYINAFCIKSDESVSVCFFCHSTQCEAAERSLQEQVARIHGLESQIQQTQRSIPMQLMNRYQRIIEKLLRRGTRCRRYYELVLTAIRIILNEGWKSFMIQFRQRYKKGM